MYKAPISIYLDSSDYSRFADVGYRDNQAVAATLDFLKEKKAKGLVEIRFSAFHLFEFLKDPTQRDLALRKVQVIEELCGDLAFRYITDVFDREIEALGSDAFLRPLVISDDGEWFPATPDHTLDRGVLVDGLAEKFPMLSRAQIEAFLPQVAERAKKEMSELLPLASVYESALVDRFLSGDISGRVMAREMAKGFAKPRILIGHYLAGNAQAQEFFGILGAGERTLHEQLVRSRKEINAKIQRLLRLGNDIKEIRRQLKGHSFPSSATYLGLDKLPANVRDALGRGRYLEELPAISTHCNLKAAYIRDILYPSAVMPEIKESDVADIFHATYLPYVELYRTDGRFSSLVEKLPIPKTVRVVSKLGQLPQAVEEQLAKRAL